MTNAIGKSCPFGQRLFALFIAGLLGLYALSVNAAENKDPPTTTTTRGGIDLIFLVDTSATMIGKAGGKNIFPEVKRVLKEWISSAQVGDHVLLITYDATVKARPTAQILGEPDKKAIAREIDDMVAKGAWTYTAEALRYGLAEAARLDDAQGVTGKKNTKVVILLTDGINDPPKEVRGTDAEVKLSQVAMQYKDKPWFVWQVQLGAEPDAGVKSAFVDSGFQRFAPVTSAPGKLNDVREKIQAEVVVVAEKAKEVAPPPPPPLAETKPPTPPPAPAAPKPLPPPEPEPNAGLWALYAVGGLLLLGVLGFGTRAILIRPKPHGVLQIVSPDGASQELDFDTLGKSSYRVGPDGSDANLGLPTGDGLEIQAERRNGQVLCIVTPCGNSEIQMNRESRVQIELFDQDEFMLFGFSLRYTGNTGPRT